MPEDFDNCPRWAVQPELMDLELDGCNLECPIDVGICEAVTNMFLCQANGTEVSFKDMNVTRANVSQGTEGPRTLDLFASFIVGVHTTR